MGSTWDGGAPRLDAWAMRRSWTRWTTWGYEIKVSRGDFLKDEKWREYLSACHSFSFVCPSGLIQPSEIPEVAGLLWASKTGNRLYTKKKALDREIDSPVQVLVYLLMCRSRIVPTMYEAGNDKRDFYRQWAAQKAEDRRLGAVVRDKILEGLRAQEVVALRKQHEAEALARVAKESLEKFRKLGIDVDKGPREIARGIDQLIGAIPDGFRYQLTNVAETCSRLAKVVAEIKGADDDRR